jgi:AraC-like DNA-binding protein
MMHDNYPDQINFKQLARVAGMSYNHFIRHFKGLFGVLPSKYLIRVRIQAACRMLEQSNETISSIALQSGFFDHSHFSRVFSEVMSMSPSAYRKAHDGNRPR